MATPKTPSPAGCRVLRNLAAGREGTFGLHGMSAFGGYFRTILALRNAGLVTPSPDEKLTELGQDVVATLLVRLPMTAKKANPAKHQGSDS